MRRGFTLLELLVAIALAGGLLMLAAQVFQAAVRTQQRVRTVGSDSGALRRAYETINRDLHSAVVPPDDSGATFGLAASPMGAPSGVFQFASVVGEPMLVGRAANETTLIQYSLEEDPRDGKTALFRRETPYPVQDGGTVGATDDTRVVPLLTNVVDVTYLFYSADQQNWVESWDGLTGLPTAVRMDVSLQEPGSHGDPQHESWVFTLPAATFANDEAAAAANAGTAADPGAGTSGAGQ